MGKKTQEKSVAFFERNSWYHRTDYTVTAYVCDNFGGAGCSACENIRVIGT